MLPLLEALGGATSLALIGMGKNVGKTTVLNALVEQGGRAGKALGLTSIGRDGELVDAITSHAKPPIRVVAGTLLATVRGSLPELDGAFEVLEDVGMRTALGPVLLVRALRPAQWELSGPALGSNLLSLRRRFFELGAELVLFDGAFDRRSSATPGLTDATLLVSGAALDPDMQVVLQETAHRVELFQLPAAELPRAAEDLLADHGLGVLFADGSVERWDLRSALGCEATIAARYPREARALLLGSALTPPLLQALEACAPLEVVIRDGTSALVGPLELKRFRSRGGCVRVWRPIRLPFLAANPFSPYGWRFPAEEFLDRLAEAVAPLAVVDVVLEQSRGLEVKC